MSHEQEYVKRLNNYTLEEFVKSVDESEITDPQTRAIVFTLKNSIIALNSKINPIQLDAPLNKTTELNQPHKQ
jgi:hypothetical protein